MDEPKKQDPKQSEESENSPKSIEISDDQLEDVSGGYAGGDSQKRRNL